MQGKAHGVHPVKVQGRFAQRLGGVHMEAAVGPIGQQPGHLSHRLHGAKLAVHGGEGHQNGVLAQQLAQLLQVNGAVSLHVQQVDLIALLLQGGEAAAHRGVLQRGGDDVPAHMAAGPGNALDGGVVGLAGAGSIDQLRWSHPQQGGNAVGDPGQLFPGRQTGGMIGIGVPVEGLLGGHKAFQYRGVRRGVGGIIKIDHAKLLMCSKRQTKPPLQVQRRKDGQVAESGTVPRMMPPPTTTSPS